jgi:phage repressor protein C with HTH and peptisase S24 domain
MNATLVQNLKTAMQQRDLNALELARQSGLKSSFIYDILNGKSANPSPIRLATLADALEISLTELLGIASSPPRAKAANDDYVMITSILVAASAGGGAAALEEREGDPYYFRRSWVRDRLCAKPEDLRMIFIEGDSMEPTLCQSDMILVDITKKNPSPPGIFVLFDGFGLVAKRLEFLGNSQPPSLRILSDNPQYLPYERAVAEVTIIGRVVWFAREM